MRRYFLGLLLFLMSTVSARSQRYFDSLQHELRYAKEDSNKVNILYFLALYHAYNDTDSTNYYAREINELSEKINYPLGKYLVSLSTLHVAVTKANYPGVLEMAQDMLKIAESLPYKRLYRIAMADYYILVAKGLMRDTSNAMKLLKENQRLIQESGDMDGDTWGPFTGYSRKFLPTIPDSAIFYAQEGYKMALQSVYIKPYMSLATAALANTYRYLGRYPEARKYYGIAIEQAEYFNSPYLKARVYKDLTDYFIIKKDPDSTIYFGKLALQVCNENHFGDYASTVSKVLSNFYESQHKPDSALRYLKISVAATDTIFSGQKMQEFQKLINENEQKQKEAVAAKERFQDKVRLYASLAGVGVFLLLSGILYRNNRQKQNANIQLHRQKEQIEDTLTELRSTQNLLIQSEKMASLGELTAGIAHEIQNPLNFVNNFAQVNAELIDEAEQATDAGNLEEVKKLLTNLKDNEVKINQHGQRADAIVKGMLQHLRTSEGHKEPTDINGLADEYFRLSYHGFRAKNKEFNTTINTDFDPSIGNINLIPQEIGRVLLNIYNNAFYAVGEKKRQQPEGYEPTVSVSTKKLTNKIEIRIKDNGNGVPQKVLDKIFNPFFTTKPTGQGTGLGLSLSYDIITKEHGGTIKVETQEGNYAEFIIRLPETVTKISDS